MPNPVLQSDDNPPVTAAAFPAWQWSMARFAQQQGAISVYTQAFISCLDPTPLARISAPDGTGTSNLTLLHIITRLEELYGCLPAAVLTLELNKLDMPFAHGMCDNRLRGCVDAQVFLRIPLTVRCDAFTEIYRVLPFLLDRSQQPEHTPPATSLDKPALAMCAVEKI